MSTLGFSQLLGNYGEFVGAIAIVGTLVYLAVQVRQNTRMMRASIRQARSDTSAQLWARGANSIVAEIQAKEARGETLDDVEERRMVMWHISQWRVQQTNFFQALEGLLDENTREEQSAIVKNLMSTDSSRKFWSENRRGFDSRFAAWVDEATASKR